MLFTGSMVPNARFQPQLATPAREPPAGDDWLHEIKLDGYRIGCQIAAGKASFLSRQGHDWSAKFPEIRAAMTQLGIEESFLDGEIAVVLPNGRTSFGALQQMLAGGPRAGLVYFLFDLLRLDGEDVAALPIEERKKRLAGLLKRAPLDLPLRYVDDVRGNGPAVFAEACKMGLEGIVSKRLGLPYRPGRSPGWLKTKGSLRQEFVIGGFTGRAGGSRAKGQGTGQGPAKERGQEIGALLCGTYAQDGRLVFAGKVGTGFSARQAEELRSNLEELTATDCPFTPPPDAFSSRGARWIRPVLVAEIAFAGWTDDGKIRHASFVGRRTDKAARTITREHHSLAAPK